MHESLSIWHRLTHQSFRRRGQIRAQSDVVIVLPNKADNFYHQDMLQKDRLRGISGVLLTPLGEVEHFSHQGWFQRDCVCRLISLISNEAKVGDMMNSLGVGTANAIDTDAMVIRRVEKCIVVAWLRRFDREF